MREPTALPIVFRPDPGLRWISAAAGLLCVAAAIGSFALYVRTGDLVRVVGGIVLGLPALLALGIARRKFVLGTEGLTVTGLVRSRHVGWPEVLAIEQTRRSFIIVTERGDISASWIAAASRDLLFRKVLELARLVLEPKEQRWGIRARFIRSQPSNLIRGADLLQPKAPPRKPE
jgi:hypothetical protein